MDIAKLPSSSKVVHLALSGLSTNAYIVLFILEYVVEVSIFFRLEIRVQRGSALKQVKLTFPSFVQFLTTLCQSNSKLRPMQISTQVLEVISHGFLWRNFYHHVRSKCKKIYVCFVVEFNVIEVQNYYYSKTKYKYISYKANNFGILSIMSWSYKNLC